MRILSVRQPWALHIIQSGKDVENRVRNLAGSYRGPVAIHAGLRPDDSALYRLPRLPENGIPREFHYGAIIGVAELVGVHSSGIRSCHILEHPGEGLCSEWAEAGFFHLRFERPRRLRRPIPFTGSLGMRELPADIEAEISKIGFDLDYERFALMEEGRRLASRRDDLIAQGVDPAELVIPLAPESDVSEEAGR